MALNPDRLADLFTTLCEIDSPSTKEGKVAALLKQICAEDFPTAKMTEDDSARVTGSDCGNLLVRFEGALPLEPVFFNCHLDTVQPGEGVRVERNGNLFFSQGETILGGDDKSGIAILLEVMRSLQEEQTPHGPVELVFTTCEEVGLLGAKAFDVRQLTAAMGYALDSTGTNQVIIGAPAANQLAIEVKGLAAHAGLNPEQGINAIRLASIALAEIPQGRLDEESTANMGLISGGSATNIVPDLVTIKGEVRSHSEEKLARYTQQIEQGFAKAVHTWQQAEIAIPGLPSFSFQATPQYPALKLTSKDLVIQRINQAAGRLDRSLRYVVAGGGSDANVFSGKGLQTAILGTGMQKVHTTEEQISLEDMLRTAELLQAVITA